MLTTKEVLRKDSRLIAFQRNILESMDRGFHMTTFVESSWSKLTESVY